MAERALDDLHLIMADQSVGMRQRINAAVSASRVEPLSLPGETEPPGVQFLRWIIDHKFDNGARFSPQFRRESAAALAYYQRRATKMALMFQVPDTEEQRRGWRAIINGALRVQLVKGGHWPERKDVLLTAADTFALPPGDPEVVVSAIMLPAGDRKPQRRKKAIDERVAGVWNGTEQERLELLRPVERIVRQRLEEFGLTAPHTS